MVPTILVIEGSEIQSRMVSEAIRRSLSLETWEARSLEQVQNYLSRKGERPLIAVSNLQLEGAQDGEAVDVCLDAGIPTLVLTSTYDPEIRKNLLDKQVVDYVIKSANSLNQITGLIRQLIKNSEFEVLIVDDSKLFRQEQSRLLRLMRLKTHEAEDGKQALVQLAQHPGIRLVLTDLEMPNLDGLALTNEIRKKYPKERLAVVGLSAYAVDETSAMFIKNGANDFLRKPFLQEEFNCRVMQNLEMIDLFDQLLKAAHADYLTGISNRRYFFSHSGSKLKPQVAQGVAMFDLDFFKKINDTYGHEAGDQVLVTFASLLDQHLGKLGQVARLGGEEFAAFFLELPPDQARTAVEGLRQAVAQTQVALGQQRISMTVSVGFAVGPYGNLEQYLAEADKNLYFAKESGRNQVVG